jgi:hypothetical protein
MTTSRAPRSAVLTSSILCASFTALDGGPACAQAVAQSDLGRRVDFDIPDAIESYQIETRSCCALWPGHHMDLPGSVGVIFNAAFAHVVSVLADDSGSSDFGGSENSGGYSPSEETILDSINAPFGGYNEWRVRGAEPIGIFVANPNDIQVKKRAQVRVGAEVVDEIGCMSVPISAVVEAFPFFPIYTMGADGLVKIKADHV